MPLVFLNDGKLVYYFASAAITHTTDCVAATAHTTDWVAVVSLTTEQMA